MQCQTDGNISKEIWEFLDRIPFVGDYFLFLIWASLSLGILVLLLPRNRRLALRYMRNLAWFTLLMYFASIVSILSNFDSIFCTIDHEIMPILEFVMRTFMSVLFILGCLILIKKFSFRKYKDEDRDEIVNDFCQNHWLSNVIQFKPKLQRDLPPQHHNDFQYITVGTGFRDAQQKAATLFLLGIMNFVLAVYIGIIYVFKIHDFAFIEIKVPYLNMSFQWLIELIISFELSFMEKLDITIVYSIRCIIFIVFMATLGMFKSKTQ